MIDPTTEDLAAALYTLDMKESPTMRTAFFGSEAPPSWDELGQGGYTAVPRRHYVDRATRIMDALMDRDTVRRLNRFLEGEIDR